jgi:aminoglycoside phosphotransferase (APT) family kinase protein
MGLPVAEPLHHDRERPDLAAAAHRPAWCVDRWIDGERTAPDTADAVWRGLGGLLATLHGLPVDGHGRLTAADGPRGRRDRVDAGIADRYDDPWPFAGPTLAGHPLAEAAPDLVARLARLEGAIRVAADRRVAITHGDLNGANIRHAVGRLAGVIDFADATVLAPAWDFASLRHFHGPEAVTRTLAGYGADPPTARELGRDALLLAPVIALHHLSRARTLGMPARRDYAVACLRRDLDAIERS